MTFLVRSESQSHIRRRQCHSIHPATTSQTYESLFITQSDTYTAGRCSVELETDVNKSNYTTQRKKEEEEESATVINREVITEKRKQKYPYVVYEVYILLNQAL